MRAPLPDGSSRKVGGASTLVLVPGDRLATDMRVPGLPCPHPWGIDTTPGLIASVTSTGTRISPASDFTVRNGAIPFGLSAIRNVGEGLVGLIVAEREANGPFADLVCRSLLVKNPDGKTTVQLEEGGDVDLGGNLKVTGSIEGGSLLFKRHCWN